jgi:hypothetical protein
MRKQLIKGFTMLLVIMTLAMVTAVASANGQTLTATKAKVPFEFVVGDKNLPAGSYTIRAITEAGDALRIRGVDSEASAVRVTMPAKGKANHAKLVFHRYDQRYFLAEVWSTNNDGRELMTSRQERAIQKELSRIASSKPSRRAYETLEIAIALQ